MPTPKEAIAEALQTLDHSNDALWTDDGAPLVAEVARICNDTKITRQMINDALPGFARKTAESTAEDEQPGDEANEELDEITAAAPVAPVTDETGEPLSPEEEYQRLRAIAQRRVDDAQDAITEAKNEVSKAQRKVVEAEQRHTRALQLFAAKYPPLTTAENIQQHLARQQEILRERVTGSRFEPNAAQNPIDETLMGRKRGGNTGQRSFLPLATGG